VTPDRQLLFLIGYRGTGKSTVAWLVAARLGWDWLDADELLEQRAGCSIRQIFAQEGETGFRDKESVLLGELCQRRRLVVATGGGVILREENRMHLRAGLVVWLTADAETLWNRLQGDAATRERRPDLAQGGRAEVEELLRKRAPLYAACANFIIDATQPAEQVADAIHEWMVNPVY
jgi:shikimate kinase